LIKELPKPTSFGHAVGHVAVLNLDAQLGDNVLALGGSRDLVDAEEHSVAQGGPTCIRVTHPIRIRVDCQLRGGGGASHV
jgi:hypothetical protein